MHARNTVVSILVWLVCLAGMASGIDLGVVSTTDNLRFEVQALDSSGVPQAPDSGHVLVWFEEEATANAASYSSRWTTSGAGGAEIDSVRYASHTYYYFVDQVTDIDNDEGNGVYSGVVVLYTKLLPTPNSFSFTLAGDELSDYWTEVKRIGDSINAYDNWVARQTTVTGTMTANLAEISGDSAAADKLETMLDGTGGQTLSLGQLCITGASGPTGSFRVENSSGPAVYWRSTSSNGDGLVISADAGDAVELTGAGAGNMDIRADVAVLDTTSTGQQLAVMPDHWNAADSTAYQGSASGLDSSDIARAVWNTPAANHSVAGTFGTYLDTAVSSFTVGSGAFSTTFTAYDTSSAQPVAGVRLAVWNSELTSLKAVIMTGSTGEVGINVDSGTYVISATAPGYIFAAYDTIVVTASQTDTVSGYQFDPGTPSSPDLCRVYGYLYTAEGEAESGARISAWLPSGVTRLENLIISPAPVSVTSTDSGYFYLDLIPSSLLNGEPKYEITINRTDGTILRKRVAVPDTDQWQLTW